MIDYEQIPFRCRRCHEHGHFFRDNPQNKKPRGKKDQENQDAEGFTRVPNKKILAKKAMGSEIHKKVQTRNSFDSLQEGKSSKTKKKGQTAEQQDLETKPSLKAHP